MRLDAAVTKMRFVQDEYIRHAIFNAAFSNVVKVVSRKAIMPSDAELPEEHAARLFCRKRRSGIGKHLDIRVWEVIQKEMTAWYEQQGLNQSRTSGPVCTHLGSNLTARIEYDRIPCIAVPHPGGAFHCGQGHGH